MFALELREIALKSVEDEVNILLKEIEVSAKDSKLSHICKNIPKPATIAMLKQKGFIIEEQSTIIGLDTRTVYTIKF